MSFSKVTAIVRPSKVDEIEGALQKSDIPGLTVSQVKGYGSYADFYSNDWMVSHVRLEVIIASNRAEGLAETIIKAAHTGMDGDGLVTISPVSHMYHIKTQAKCDHNPC